MSKQKELIKMMISEMINSINEFDLGKSIDTTPPSITVSNPPLNMDTNLDKNETDAEEPITQQLPSSDAENMSVEQIARVIEDTVETEVNGEESHGSETPIQ